eukprot:2123916-Amphidinium_carterae.1
MIIDICGVTLVGPTRLPPLAHSSGLAGVNAGLVQLRAAESPEAYTHNTLSRAGAGTGAARQHQA